MEPAPLQSGLPIMRACMSLLILEMVPVRDQIHLIKRNKVGLFEELPA